jgi:hypothetical protein
MKVFTKETWDIRWILIEHGSLKCNATMFYHLVMVNEPKLFIIQLLQNVWYFIYVMMKFGCSLQWTINILLNAWLLFLEDEKQVDLYYLLKVLFGIQLLGTPMFTHVLNLKYKSWFTKEKCFTYSQVATHTDLLEKFKIER